jgi:hypothetical protein
MAIAGTALITPTNNVAKINSAFCMAVSTATLDQL